MFLKALVLSCFSIAKMIYIYIQKKANEDFNSLGCVYIDDPDYVVHLGKRKSSIVNLEFHGNCRP